VAAPLTPEDKVREWRLSRRRSSVIDVRASRFLSVRPPTKIIQGFRANQQDTITREETSRTQAAPAPHTATQD